MSELATYRLHGRIATIAIDDGKVNALSIPMLRCVHAALDQAERDQAIVILCGREGCFSAGFDIKVFAAGTQDVAEMLTLGATLTERLLAFPSPVVAACSGHALAAGASLLLAADARISADGPFQIGLNEVGIGLTVPWFVIELARYRLNPAHFDRALVTAGIYTLRQAVTAGFLDHVVTAADLQPAATDAANALAQFDARAHHNTKLRARESTLKAIREAIESELTPQNLTATRD